MQPGATTSPPLASARAVAGNTDTWKQVQVQMHALARVAGQPHGFSFQSAPPPEAPLSAHPPLRSDAAASQGPPSSLPPHHSCGPPPAPPPCLVRHCPQTDHPRHS
eukprot:6819183-Prymnesium_polylepis.1